MIQLTAKTIAALLNIPIAFETPLSFSGISIDSRSVTPGNLFIAIKGAQFDGHDFIHDAYKQGAALALVTRHVDCAIPQLIVTDTTLALGMITSHWRQQFNLPLIAVTGSNGKTTVKNMIASILRTYCKRDDAVLATSGNLNNHWGVPLTLARLSDTHRYAVIEMGMNHVGELDYLTHLAGPTAALITNIGAAHLEGVGGELLGVAKAKAEIFAGVQATGTVILNRDEPFYSMWHDMTRHLKACSFGLDATADIHGEQIEMLNTLQRFKVTTPFGNDTIELPLLGEHNVKNALAAIAACTALEVPIVAIKQGLSNLHPEKSRLCLSVLPSGTKIIDDTYNANPDSFTAAINTLARFNATTVLVMGDMKELGAEAGKWHDLVGKKAKAAGITHLFTYGELSQLASLAFGNQAQHFSDRHALCDAVKKYCIENTTILIKGSRAMQMEKVVHCLSND